MNEPHRRLNLLLGSPRSGTTWLAKILDTYPRVLYLHEPLTKLQYGPLDSMFARLKNQEQLSYKERDELIDHLAQLHPACMRAPVFPKDFQRLPARAVQSALFAAQPSRWGQDLFRHVFRPSCGQSFDLLIKEVDWQLHCASLVDNLRPDRVVFIIRHPCGVVCSRLIGLKMGVMPGHDRDHWLNSHKERAAAVGFSEVQVRKLGLCGFYALDWLLQNLEYQRIAKARSDCRTVVYETLCRDPHPIANELFAFLGWEMPPETARFIRDSGRAAWRRLYRWFSNWRTYYDLHRDPHEAAGRWQSILTRQQVDEILAVTQSFPNLDWWPEEKALATSS